MGDKGDKSAARLSEGSLVETRCLIKGPKSAIVPFAELRSGPKSRTGSGASQKAKSQELAWSLNTGESMCPLENVALDFFLPFASGAQHVKLILFCWFLRWEVSDRSIVILYGSVLIGMDSEIESRESAQSECLDDDDDDICWPN